MGRERSRLRTLRWYLDQVSPEPRALAYARAYIPAHVEGANVGALSLADWAEVRGAMAKAGLSIGTVKRYLSVIRVALEDYADRGIIPEDAVVPIRTLKIGRARKEGAAEAEVREAVSESAYLATLPELPEWASAACRLLWFTGARPSEILGLDQARLDRSDTVWIYEPAKHKTAGKAFRRFIGIGPQGQAVLGPRLGRRLLFPTRQGNPASADVLKTAVRRAAQAAGVEHWCVYQLRHAFATRAEAMIGHEAAQIALGHGVGHKTTQRYIHRDLTRLKEIMLVLG